MDALSKGWSFFSSATSGATRASIDIIQPGMERAMDPNLQTSSAGTFRSKKPESMVEKSESPQTLGVRTNSVWMSQNEW